MSPKNTLSKQDIKEWLLQTFIYSIVIPATIVVLTSLEHGVDFKTALVAGAYSIISALVNLLMKLSAGGTTPAITVTSTPTVTQ